MHVDKATFKWMHRLLGPTKDLDEDGNLIKTEEYKYGELIE